VALYGVGYSRPKAVGIALATGLVEPLGALVGVTAVSMAAPLLPWGLAFAAGAMIFVVSNEIIPETHRAGLEKAASVGLMLGFVIMLYLDVSLS
jgi:ZIP family zinc transporter